LLVSHILQLHTDKKILTLVLEAKYIPGCVPEKLSIPKAMYTGSRITAVLNLELEKGVQENYDKYFSRTW
jgi:hypothetical protein